MGDCYETSILMGLLCFLFVFIFILVGDYTMDHM